MLKNLNTSTPPAPSPKREESSDTDETSAVQYAGRGGAPPSRTAKPLLAALPRTSTTKASKGLPRRTCCRCLGYAALLLLTVGSAVIGYGVSELMKGERSLNVALKKNLRQMKTSHFAMRKELERQKELHGKHNSMISALTDAKGTLSTQLAEQKDTFATNEQKLKETGAAIKKLKAEHEQMLVEKESTHKELVAKLEARLKAHATKLEEHAQKETQWSLIKHQIFAAFGSGAGTFGDYDGGEDAALPPPPPPPPPPPTPPSPETTDVETTEELIKELEEKIDGRLPDERHAVLLGRTHRRFLR